MDAPGSSTEEGAKNKAVRVSEENWKWMFRLRYELNLRSMNDVVSVLREAVTNDEIIKADRRRRGIV